MISRQSILALRALRILIAHPAFLPSPSLAVADFVCTCLLPVFQKGCGTEQGAVLAFLCHSQARFGLMASA